MLDLIHLWKNTTADQPLNTKQSFRFYSSDTKQAAIDFDAHTIQSSFEFQEPPQVIFVKDSSTLEPANFYDDLPGLILSEEEETLRLTVAEEEQARNPCFYDGKQMMITGVLYDENTNIVYMEAKKIAYSFIVTLRSKRFPEHSSLYQLNIFNTGVLAPLITRDSVTVLLQRAQLGLYSVPSGFLESKDEARRLNFDDGRNLVTETALAEIKEEIAGIKGSDELRFEYSMPKITAISFRQTMGTSMRTVEFVAPSYVDCHSSYLQQVIQHPLSEDAHEHTLQHELIPLDSEKRDTLLEKLLMGPVRLPGASLYLPVAMSLARIENQANMVLPRTIPNSPSIAWPLTFFITKPMKSLRSTPDENNLQRDHRPVGVSRV